MIQHIAAPKCFIGAGSAPGPWWLPWRITLPDPFAKLCVAPGRVTLSARGPYKLTFHEKVVQSTDRVLVTWRRANLMHSTSVRIDSPDLGLMIFWTRRLGKVLDELRCCGFSVQE